MASDLQSFRQTFKGDVVTEDHPDYEASITRWALNSIRRAKVVAFVKDASDVALAIQYAKSAGLPIAIRSGGHGASGSSSIEGGLVVDLSRHLNKVTVDPESRLAYVQGGALWRTVDETAIKHGLATVAGTVSHTGVGGLITGGGYGWLSPRYGLSIDNLIRATVVTADGSILTASKDENPDLFFGIRGGGSNFGPVTEFVLQCHPQRATVYSGVLVYMRDQVDDVAKVLDEWYKKDPIDEAIHLLFTRTPDGHPCMGVQVFYNGSEEEGRQKFKAFHDLKPAMDLSQEIPYESLNSSQDHMTAPGKPYYYRGTLRSPDTFQCVNTAVFDSVTAASESGELQVSLVFEYVNQSKINSVDPRATPYRRDLPGNALCLVSWSADAPKETEEVRRVAKALCDTITAPSAPSIGYGNYSPDSAALPVEGSVPSDRAKEMYRENYPKLQQIKRKYDPEMIFNKWFVITPA